MPNRRLTDDERAKLAPMLEEIRERLRALADGDDRLLFALRRRLWNQLQYDERLRPQYRVAIKRKKTIEQNGLCNICREALPARGAVLDRFDAAAGYNMENTQLLCSGCDSRKQRELGYK